MINLRPASEEEMKIKLHLTDFLSHKLLLCSVLRKVIKVFIRF